MLVTANSYGPVINFWFGPGSRTVASVPTVPQYWFWFLLLNTREHSTRFQGTICIFLISVVVRFHFGHKSGGSFGNGT